MADRDRRVGSAEATAVGARRACEQAGGGDREPEIDRGDREARRPADCETGAGRDHFHCAQRAHGDRRRGQADRGGRGSGAGGTPQLGGTREGEQEARGGKRSGGDVGESVVQRLASLGPVSADLRDRAATRPKAIGRAPPPPARSVPPRLLRRRCARRSAAACVSARRRASPVRSPVSTIGSRFCNRCRHTGHRSTLDSARIERHVGHRNMSTGRLLILDIALPRKILDPSRCAVNESRGPFRVRATVRACRTRTDLDPDDLDYGDPITATSITSASTGSTRPTPTQSAGGHGTTSTGCSFPTPRSGSTPSPATRSRPSAPRGSAASSPARSSGSSSSSS